MMERYATLSDGLVTPNDFYGITPPMPTPSVGQEARAGP
jgi:hypothetical protein